MANKQELAALQRLKSEPDSAKWNIKDCRAVDHLVKMDAIKTLKMKLKKEPKLIKNFVVDMVSYEFGTGEVDEFLMAMDCYNKNYLIK
jgi:hypothetical protein